MTEAQARVVLRSMPWPEGEGPPGVDLSIHANGAHIARVQRGKTVAAVGGHTPERALWCALQDYVKQRRLEVPVPRFDN